MFIILGIESEIDSWEVGRVLGTLTFVLTSLIHLAALFFHIILYDIEERVNDCVVSPDVFGGRVKDCSWIYNFSSIIWILVEGDIGGGLI